MIIETLVGTVLVFSWLRAAWAEMEEPTEAPAWCPGEDWSWYKNRWTRGHGCNLQVWELTSDGWVYHESWNVKNGFPN